MEQEPLIRRARVSPTQVVAWMREVIAHAVRLPKDLLTTTIIAPAGQVIETNFDDPELEEAYRARLFSAAVAARPADRLFILSGEAHGIVVPEWDTEACPAPAFQRMIAAAGLRAAYPGVPRLWRFYDPHLRVGVQLSGTEVHLPRRDGSAPLRYYLHWILEGAGLRLVHASSLGWRGRGVVLFGPSGVGKSGTTLAGLETGLSTVGDDLIALGIGDAPFTRALFTVVKQDKAGLARIPRLSQRTAHRPMNWYGKVEFHPDDYFPGALVDELTLVAALVPRITHADKPSFVPATSADAMRALMNSNIGIYPGATDSGMAFFGRFLGRLPTLRLELSDDAAKNGDAVRQFLEQSPAP